MPLELFDQIDQVKEREAERRGLESLTETRTAICHSRGLDFETIARTLQREEKLLKKLGLQSTPAAPAKADAKNKLNNDASEHDQQNNDDEDQEKKE